MSVMVNSYLSASVLTGNQTFDRVKIMSKSVISRTSAVLVGLSLLAVVGYPVFARDEVVGSNIRPAVRQDASAVGAIKGRPLSLGGNVENRIENIKDKLASRDAALKAKLDAFKDKKKAAVAERVNANLNRINQNQTDQMRKNLSTMTSILDKLEARVDRGSPDVKDPAATKIAIASARATIATDTAAVTTQSGKDYTISVTSETRIREDVKTMRDKLFTDLKTAREGVIGAKQLVVNAIRVAKSGNPLPLSTGLKKEGTASGSK